MPQVFWATCPSCETRFTCEKEIWDQDHKMLCPSCLKYFKRKDSPKLETVWPVTFQDMKSMAGGKSEDQKKK
jgi:hypothetical protein